MEEFKARKGQFSVNGTGPLFTNMDLSLGYGWKAEFVDMYQELVEKNYPIFMVKKTGGYDPVADGV